MRRSGTSGSEALHDLLTRALTPAGVPSKKPRSDGRKEAKWRKEHAEYRKQHNLVTDDAFVSAVTGDSGTSQPADRT